MPRIGLMQAIRAHFVPNGDGAPAAPRPGWPGHRHPQPALENDPTVVRGTRVTQLVAVRTTAPFHSVPRRLAGDNGEPVSLTAPRRCGVPGHEASQTRRLAPLRSVAGRSVPSLWACMPWLVAARLPRISSRFDDVRKHLRAAPVKKARPRDVCLPRDCTLLRANIVGMVRAKGAG
jgi:hypothetical protein